MDTDYRRQSDNDIREIKGSLKDIATSYQTLSNKQSEMAAHHKNIANMVNEYNKDNKDAHKTFYRTESSLIALAVKFNEHKENHKEHKQNKRDGKGTYALFISCVMFIFVAFKWLFTYFITKPPIHPPTIPH